MRDTHSTAGPRRFVDGSHHEDTLPRTREEPTRTPGSHPTAVRDTHLTKENTPERQGINAQTPDSMPRAEDDAATRAHSPAFHDPPGSGKNIADRRRFF
jgi:hypothetical protein